MIFLGLPVLFYALLGAFALTGREPERDEHEMFALLDVLLRILDLGLRLPGATFRVPSAPLWVWILYGAAVALLVWATQRRKAFVPMFFLITFVLQIWIAIGDFSPN